MRDVVLICGCQVHGITHISGQTEGRNFLPYHGIYGE